MATPATQTMDTTPAINKPIRPKTSLPSQCMEERRAATGVELESLGGMGLEDIGPSAATPKGRWAVEHYKNPLPAFGPLPA